MRFGFLGLTAAGLAALAIGAPVAAESAAAGPPAFASRDGGFHGGFGTGHRRHDGRHSRHFDRGFGGAAWIDYDREYQGDTAWRSNSFNDWWHDRPDRAYPRWMQNNPDCERRWSDGAGWRC